jgi:methyltransferase
VVTAEILVLPLAFGLWRTALVFSAINAILLTVRVHSENRALGR